MLKVATSANAVVASAVRAMILKVTIMRYEFLKNPSTEVLASYWREKSRMRANQENILILVFRPSTGAPHSARTTEVNF